MINVIKYLVRGIRTLLATRFKKFYLAPGLSIANGVHIYPVDQVVIGSNTMIGRDVIISSNRSGESRVLIGDNVMIAHRTLIIGGNHEFSKKGIPMNQQGEGKQGDILIEDDVWIGAGCIILSGSHIESGSIIAAGSVVRGFIPKESIAGGSPARVIKSRFNENIPS